MKLNFWLQLLAMPLVVVGIVAGCMGFAHLYTHHGEEIAIPNLRGQRVEVVIRKLEALGLHAEIADTGYNARFVADAVLAQSLSEGYKVKAGRIIYLTINAAAPFAIPIPLLADNCSLREARMKLEALGFRLAPIKRVAGDLDWVYRVLAGNRELKSGDRVNVNIPITLEVGDGHAFDEFNGNDSLDFQNFAEDSVIYEAVETEAVDDDAPEMYP